MGISHKYLTAPRYPRRDKNSAEKTLTKMGKSKTTSITNNDLANLTLIGTLAGVFLSTLRSSIPIAGNKEEEDDLKRIDFIMYYIKAFRDG